MLCMRRAGLETVLSKIHCLGSCPDEARELWRGMLF